MTRDLKIVSAAMLTWGIGEGLFFIFQPLYIQQLGADPILIGLLLGVNGLVMTVSQIPSGILADRIGRRPIMWVSWFSGLTATWLMALAPSLGVFVAGMLLYGLTSSVMAPLNTYIQGAKGDWSLGRAVSFVTASFNVGAIFGPIFGGLLADAYSLRAVYFAAGVVFAVSTAIILLVKNQPVQKKIIIEGDRHSLQNKQFFSMLWMIALVMLALMLPQPLTANFLQNQQGLSLGKIGQLGSIYALGSVLMALIFGHLPAGLALIIGQAGLVIFAILIWQGSGLAWFSLAYLFLGGYRLSRGMAIALVQPLVLEHEVGLAFGMVETLNAFAIMAAPVIAGYLYSWQPASIYPVSIVVLLFSIGFSLRYFYNQKLEKTRGTIEEEGII